MSSRILRFRAVQERVPFSRTTIWKWEKAGKFPKRRQVGVRAVGWLENEIEQWVKRNATVGTKRGLK